jgi:hypothetical protein
MNKLSLIAAVLILGGASTGVAQQPLADLAIVQDGGGFALWGYDLTLSEFTFGAGAPVLDGYTFPHNELHQYMMADVNGDGISDRVVIIDNVFVADISDGSGPGEFGNAESDYAASFGATFAEGWRHRVGDINGDGYADRMPILNGAEAWVWFVDFSTPTGWGDGTPDNTGNQAFGAPTHQVSVGDFNGDGFRDRVVFIESLNRVDVDYSVAGNFGDGTADLQVTGILGNIFQGTPLFIAPNLEDFNGDGLADIHIYQAAGDASTCVTTVYMSPDYTEARQATLGAASARAMSGHFGGPVFSAVADWSVLY